MTNIPTQIANLVLSSINIQDDTYNLYPQGKTKKVEQELVQSIQQFGLLQLPLVWQGDENYLILSGKKRILAAENLGWLRVPCLVMPEATPAFLKWKLLLSHAVIGSRLSYIEQAVFFDKAGRELDTDSLVSLLPLLGLKKNPRLLVTFAQSLTLTPEVIHGLHHGSIQPKSIDLLQKCTDQDQKTLTRLIEDFQLGGSKQKNLILLALDLTRRLNSPLREIIETWERERRDRDRENKPQQAAELLDWLARKQSPRHYQAQQEFKSFVRAMRMPKSCTVSPTTSFEDEQITLKIRFPDRNHFRAAWDTIRPVLENSRAEDSHCQVG